MHKTGRPPPRLPTRKIRANSKSYAFNSSPNWDPALRQRGLKQLLAIFRPLVEKGVPQTALIMGPEGTVKTTLVKRFCKETEAAGRRSGRRIVTEVVNCRPRNTSSEILNYLLISRFNLDIRERGFSVPELLDILGQNLSRKCIHLIVVLDDAEWLFRTEGPDLLYNFSLLNYKLVHTRGSISFILISSLDAREFMNSVTASIFGHGNIIHLSTKSENLWH